MKHKSGQVMVLVVLVALMGVTLGLSQFSRSLSDLKQVSTVDSGTTAYAGAEAGLQYALSRLSAGYTNINGNIDDLPPGITSLAYDIKPTAVNTFTTYSGVLSDSVIQLDAKQFSAGVTSVDIYWSNPAAAVEIVDLNATNQILRYAYNGLTPIVANSGFSSSAVASVCTCSDPGAAAFAAGRCVAGISITNLHQLLRIKPLMTSSGSTTDIGVCAKGGASPTLGSTSYLVTVIAKTTNNTQKKLQTIKYPAALPSIFDNVIFTTGSIVKN